MKFKKIEYTFDPCVNLPFDGDRLFKLRHCVWIPSRDSVEYIPSKFLPNPNSFLEPVYFAMGMVRGERGISCSFSGVN
jgi:hypothetical protein